MKDGVFQRVFCFQEKYEKGNTENLNKNFKLQQIYINSTYVSDVHNSYINHCHDVNYLKSIIFVHLSDYY